MVHVYLVEGTKFEVKTTVRAIATDNTIVRGDPMILWYFWMWIKNVAFEVEG